MSPTPLTASDAMLRFAGMGALTALAVVHLWALPHKLAEATYMAVLFGGLIVAAMALALALVEGGPLLGRWAWLSAGGLALAALGGYVLTRTVPLPQLEDHVGHWQDPLGSASLVIEAAIIALAPLGLRRAGTGRPGKSQRQAALLAAAWALAVVGAVTVAPQPASADGPSAAGAHQHDGVAIPGALLLAGVLGGGGFVLTGGALLIRRVDPTPRPELRAPLQRGLQPALAACAAGVSLAPALAGAPSAPDHHGGAAHAGDHHGGGPLYPDLKQATVAQRKAARRLLDRSRAATKGLLTLDGAVAAGFERHRFPEERGQLFHMERCDNWVDERTLDPRRPESLVYWRRPGAAVPKLVAVMYRAPGDRPPPAAGTPVVHWHGHPRREGAPPGRVTGPTLMTHVWLTPHLRTAYARRPPRKALARALDAREAREAAGARASATAPAAASGSSLRYLWGGCWKRPPA
jgi:hypothetical protein